jgi:hypothetical protein
LAVIELRGAERSRSLLKAKIIFNNRMTTVDCVVKNISATGAKIAVSSALSIPNEFDLEIPMRGRTFKAQMRWRDTEGIGVEFTETVDDREPGNPGYQRLVEENARLKLSIVALTKRLTDLGQDVSTN